jgi:serine/threonine protein kinase
VSDSDRDALDRLADEFLARRRKGERPSIEEYAAAHPHLASEIRELFPTLEMMEELAPDERDTDAPPRQLGEYRILREIGRGGMGVVYEAEQVTLGRRVALKVLPFHRLLDKSRLERFRREAQAAARLHHPNIVPVHGVGEHEGTHFFAMQYVAGQGLDAVVAELKRLRRAGQPTSSVTLPRERGSETKEGYFLSVARIGIDVAGALEHAHAEGVLHRDIKPSNLLLDAEGKVWITDFGLAKADETEGLTRTGDVVATSMGWGSCCTSFLRSSRPLPTPTSTA